MILQHGLQCKRQILVFVVFSITNLHDLLITVGHLADDYTAFLEVEDKEEDNRLDINKLIYKKEYWIDTCN